MYKWESWKSSRYIWGLGSWFGRGQRDLRKFNKLKWRFTVIHPWMIHHPCLIHFCILYNFPKSSLFLKNYIISLLVSHLHEIDWLNLHFCLLNFLKFLCPLPNWLPNLHLYLEDFQLSHLYIFIKSPKQYLCLTAGLLRNCIYKQLTELQKV